MHLRASAIFYSLVMSLLVAMLLSSLIMLYGYTREEVDYTYFREQAHDNLESGINMVLYGKGLPFGEFKETLFNSPDDSFYVNSSNWGMYGLLHARGVHGVWSEEETILFGIIQEDEFAASLFLKDRNRPLTIAGDTRLQGPLYVPETGIRRGYVGSTGYTGKELFTGEKFSSKDRNVKADYSELEETRNWLMQLWESQYGKGEEWPAGDSLKAEWDAPAFEYRTGSGILLDNVNLSGHILILAPEVVITENAQIEDIVIAARRIFIEAGFKGRLQAFATDTLVVEEDVQLGYPSVLCVSNPDGAGSIAIAKGCVVEGMVINDPFMTRGTEDSGSYTLIEKEATVYGNVFTAYNLDIQGTVCGNVITEKFLLRTPSAVYENHLLGAVIRRDGLDETYGMGLLFPDAEDYVIIRRLSE